MMEWSRVEVMLGLWFGHLTNIRSWDMASAVFFSAKSFSGRAEMMQAALEHGTLNDETQEFLGAALLKAIAYNSFRNRLAHGIAPAGDNLALSEGKQWWKAGDINLPKLEAARANFRELRRLLYKAHCHFDGSADPLPPSECLRQLRLLPNEPYSSELSQRQKGRLRQLQAARPKPPTD